MRGKEPVNHRSHRPRSKESPLGIRFIGGHLLYTVQFFINSLWYAFMGTFKTICLLNLQRKSAECVHWDIFLDIDWCNIIFFSFHICLSSSGRYRNNVDWMAYFCYFSQSFITSYAVKIQLADWLKFILCSFFLFFIQLC